MKRLVPVAATIGTKYMMLCCVIGHSHGELSYFTVHSLPLHSDEMKSVEMRSEEMR